MISNTSPYFYMNAITSPEGKIILSNLKSWLSPTMPLIRMDGREK